MKILHTADIHLGDLTGPVVNGKNARRLDTLECVRAIVKNAETEQPQVAVIAGDLFNRSRVWADTALEDVNDAINEFLRPLCRTCEHVVLLFGTENHDNPKSFEVISQSTKELANLHIITHPDVYPLETTGGTVQILALPGFDKGRLRSFVPDADKETENRNATALINDVLLGLGTKLDKSIPSILVAHYTVAGSETEGGSTFLAGQDVVILPQTIDTVSPTLACFGHIHKPQKLNCKTPAFYCGSPNQLTFNDEDIAHGFYIHEIDDTLYHTSTFHNTPERKHITRYMGYDDIANAIDSSLSLGGINPNNDFSGKIVRVRYTSTDEQDKALNKAALQKAFLDGGAFHVAEIVRVNTIDDTALKASDNDETPAAALHRYLLTLRERGSELTDDDMARLEELAAPLIRKADTGQESDQHTGAFIPIGIEVKNYRSYTAASFGFDEIKMAMVNGQNGVGKSSLFMDSIADALFEESRDGQIGGWLREGEKSGSINFRFQMGGIEYRVVRTRTKSGKGTLAFDYRGEGFDWTTCGDSTMKLTQAKIERVLGMDSQTFCSIALIRQDAYGLFLEAGSDRRMEVLSALLNLGIYVRLEGFAKDNATEQRRAIAQTKDRMSVLTEQIVKKEELLEQDSTARDKIDVIVAELKTVDDDISIAKSHQDIANQADEKKSEAQQLVNELGEKDREHTELDKQRDDAQALASRMPEIEKAVNAIAAARAVLETLAPYETELQLANKDKATLLEYLSQAETKLKTLADDLQSHTSIIARKAEVENAVAELVRVREKLEEIAAKESESRAAWDRLVECKNALKAFTAESGSRYDEIKIKITVAERKAEILQNSGCPNPDNATCEFLRDAKTANESIPALREQLAAVETADKAELDRLTAEVTQAQAAFDALGNPNEGKQSLTDRKNELEPIATLAPKLEAAAASVAAIEKQQSELTEIIATKRQVLAEIAGKIPALEESAAQAAERRETIRINEPTAELQSQCASAKATAEALTARITALQADIDGILLKINAALEKEKEIRSRIPETTVDLPSLEKKRSELVERQNALISERGGIKTKLETIQDAVNQHSKYAAEIKEISRMLNDYQTLAQAFGIDGIQYMIIRSVVPEIMSRSNEILSAMTGGRMAVDFRTEREQKSSNKIVNSLDVWITSITGSSRPYNSHSGGEKVKIALAVTLGLADVKARRAGVQLGMLFIDEPPFLDADGTEAYADALTNMASRNPDMRILAISHDPTMKARFQQNILITASESGSQVTMN